MTRFGRALNGQPPKGAQASVEIWPDFYKVPVISPYSPTVASVIFSAL